MGLLVINVDHLPTHLLGPYGNSAVPTPTLNTWAGRGGVVDWAFQSGPGATLAQVPIRQDLRLTADLCLTPGQDGQWAWPGGGGDESGGEDDFFPTWVPFDLQPKLAEGWERSSVARYLERALSQWALAQPGPDARIWLDLPLLSTVWDAPRAWREYLAGDDDPEIYLGCEPPYLLLPSAKQGGLLEHSGLDPDLRMSYEHAAGAMIMLLDHGLEWLQNCLAALPGGAAMAIILTAETGFGLGEHFGLGSLPDAMWTEQTHVPMILNLGSQGSFPFRISGVQAQDRVLRHWWNDPTLLAGSSSDTGAQYSNRVIDGALEQIGWLDYSLFGQQRREAVVGVSPNQIAVRTNAWSVIWKVAHLPLLFIRPDDRFEQNDLSSRCREVAAGFQWYLPELLWYFGGQQREIPSQFRETWLNCCQVLVAEGYCPETEAPEMRLVPGDSLLAVEQLPAELWTNVV
jgi:hypothetical protein